jgi:hypothetical protein
MILQETGFMVKWRGRNGPPAYAQNRILEKVEIGAFISWPLSMFLKLVPCLYRWVPLFILI